MLVVGSMYDYHQRWDIDVDIFTLIQSWDIDVESMLGLGY